MKKLNWLMLGLLFLSGALAFAERPRSPFGVVAGLRLADGEPVVRVEFVVPGECVLYADRLHFERDDGTELTPIKIPAPLVDVDKATGHEKKMYNHSFAADLKLAEPFTGNLVVKFQGCSNSACFFPEKRFFNVTADGVFAEAAAPVAAPVEVVKSEDAPEANLDSLITDFKITGKETGYMSAGKFENFLGRAASGHVQAADDPLAKFRKVGLAATLLFILLGGVGLNLTPCVLPLIPINLAIIGAGSQAKSRGQGFMHGAVYGGGMALVYGILGLVVVLTGSKFGTLNSSVWFNVGIAAVFVVMALAMFDLFHIDFSRFDSALGRGETNVAGHSKSRTLVAFTLGAVAALLAGACVAPVVITVLLLATDLYGKGMVLGLALPFLLGVGMALPWPFAGASLTFLPKPGKWMKYVKYGFGILIFGFAFYYGHTAYDLVQNSRASTALAAAPGGGKAIEGANQSLAKALQQARAAGKPVFVDFKASWCKNCLAMDETVFNKNAVQKRLENFIVVKYEAERPNESPAKDILDKFNVMGLPTYLVLSPNPAN